MTPVHPVRRRVQFHAFQIADVVVMTGAFAVAVAVRAGMKPDRLADILQVRISLSNLILFGAFCVAWNVIFRVRGLYTSRRIEPARPEWWDVTVAVTLGTLVFGVAALVLNLELVDRVFLAAFFLVSLVTSQLMRSTMRLLLIGARKHGHNLRNVIIVGSGPRGAWFGREIRNRPDLGYLLAGYVDDIPPPVNPLHGGAERQLGSLDQVEDILDAAADSVDEVFVALPVRSYYETIARVIGHCETLGLPVRMPADAFALHLAHARVDYLGPRALLTFQTPSPDVFRLRIKRIIDVTLSALAALALLPPCLLIAAAIKLESRGPVFFVQTRVGRGRRPFRIYKFRTMVDGAEKRLGELEHRNEVRGAAFKMVDDPRVTRVGRLLRKFSLDEIPQLLNVLKGDLSLVGPRPLPVRDVERFDNAWQKRRFSVTPGVTCLWQVSGRHEVSFDHWMELDLQYIDNWSLKLDLVIMLKTLPAVLRGTGAS